MKARVLLLSCAIVLFLTASAAAKDVVLPAGTLMTCMMDEPNFSSATANVGDPFLCHPRIMQMFGKTVFPRGTYLVGHLEADKDPGHFVGKGYLKLSFDRIGLPDADLPLPAKVIAVRGYHVDRDGKIIGHGHATRDVVEWMLPPMWPWKVLTLPAKGPRPALKGEVYVTLRLMEDVTVPVGGPGPSRLGEQGALPLPGASQAPAPVVYAAPPPAVTPVPLAPVGTVPVVTAALVRSDDNPPTSLAEAATLVTVRAPRLPAVVPIVDHSGWRHFGRTKPTLFVLREGTVVAVADYWRDQDVLSYVLANGTAGAFAMRDIDWDTTSQLNAERGVRVTMTRTVTCEGKECGSF